YFKNRFPEQHLGPSVWTPNRDITIPETEHYDMKDLTPRVGVVYDLMGDGKTAIKVAWGKYMAGGNPVDGNPIFNSAQVVSRSWTPSLPCGDPNYYTPQCDLHNPNANGDCGAISNLNLVRLASPPRRSTQRPIRGGAIASGARSSRRASNAKLSPG